MITMIFIIFILLSLTVIFSNEQSVSVQALKHGSDILQFFSDSTVQVSSDECTFLISVKYIRKRFPPREEKESGKSLCAVPRWSWWPEQRDWCLRTTCLVRIAATTDPSRLCWGVWSSQISCYALFLVFLT